MTKEEFIELYVQENIVVHCPTEKLANELLAKAHEYGLQWFTGASYLDINNWSRYKKNTCYYLFKGEYSDKQWYRDFGFTIIEFNGFEGEEKNGN